MPESLSIREQLVDAVVARMRAIKTSANYRTNLGTHVEEWLSRQPGKDEMPLLDVRDPLCTSRSNEREHEHVLTVQFEVVAEISTSVRQLRACVADVLKAVGVDPEWNGLARKTEPKRDLMKVDQFGKRVGGALIEIEITFHTQAFQPAEG